MDAVLNPPPPAPALVELTAADRCDRCGAQAKSRATLPSGLDLLFCGHHTNAHLSALAAAGADLNTGPEVT